LFRGIITIPIDFELVYTRYAPYRGNDGRLRDLSRCLMAGTSTAGRLTDTEVRVTC